MKLYEDKYSEMFFDAPKSIHTHLTYSTSAKMVEAEFKEMMFAWAKTINEVKPKRALILAKDFLFLVTPDLQEWVVLNTSSKVQLEKTAFVMPEELIANLGVSQFIEEENKVKASGGEVKYFSSEQEAEKWLLG